MLAELHRYLELLVFLAGTFLYGFLTLEVIRRRRVLPGNWPLRLVLVCLTLWYGLTLGDELLDLLFGRAAWLAFPGTVLDLVRASAWLLTFPLLVHTLERVELREGLRTPGSGTRLLPYLAYATLLPFAIPAYAFFLAGKPLLAEAAQGLHPWVVAQASVTLPTAAWLASRMAKRVDDGRLASFLRWLTLVSWVMLAILAAGLAGDPWAQDARGAARWIRTLLLGGLLLPGALFAWFVQRYNLLQLSFSHRSLRHFATILALVALVMAGGPAMGVEDVRVYRLFVVWGLLLALVLGFAWAPLVDRVLARSTALRRLYGRSVAPEELERLMESLHVEDEGGALEHTAAALGAWLGTKATFLPASEGAPELAPFWNWYAPPDAPLVHRLHPRERDLATLLAKQELYAVFPLRVNGSLEGLLALSASAVGGSYSAGELDAVRLVLRQVSATLATARLAEERHAAERRVLDDERLRMLGLVAASLAHEVKNPLSSMKALTQAVREDLAAQDRRPQDLAPTGRVAQDLVTQDRAIPSTGTACEDCVADLDVVLEQIDRLDRTTREILGVARPRRAAASDPSGAVLDSTDLSSLARSVAYILGAEARKRGVTFDAEQIEEVGTVPGSEAAWQTVVFNLALNAVEHTPDGGIARLCVRGEGPGHGAVVVETSNPGPELTPEQAAQFFEPFVSEAGTGLGLALVRRRVKELGGTVEARSIDGQVIFQVRLASSARRSAS